MYFLCLVCKFSGCWLKTLQINKKYPSKFVLSNTSSSVLKVFCKLWTYTLGLREKSFVDILRLRPEREENKTLLLNVKILSQQYSLFSHRAVFSAWIHGYMYFTHETLFADNITKRCLEDGTWDSFTNYHECLDNPVPPPGTVFSPCLSFNLLRTIYYLNQSVFYRTTLEHNKKTKLLNIYVNQF